MILIVCILFTIVFFSFFIITVAIFTIIGSNIVIIFSVFYVNSAVQFPWCLPTIASSAVSALTPILRWDRQGKN